MDPLSAAASIVGILGAAATINTILKKIVGTVKNAPQQVQNLLVEVSDIAACLGQLQTFLLGTATISRSRAALLMVDQIAVTLTNCVLAFSELEEIIDELRLNQLNSPASIRLKFIASETDIAKLVARLHASKVSLNLMLTTLTWSVLAKNFGRRDQFANELSGHSNSIEEAQTSIERLTMLVHQVLQSNREISERLASLRARSSIVSSISLSTIQRNQENDDATTIRPRRWSSKKEASLELSQTTSIGFAFEQELQSSRVYRRNLVGDRESLVSSALDHSMRWSFLSDLNLTEVTRSSVISLPISSQELWNSSRYEAGCERDVRPLQFSFETEDLPPGPPGTAAGSASVVDEPAIPYARYPNQPISLFQLCKGCGKVLLNPIVGCSTINLAY